MRGKVRAVPTSGTPWGGRCRSRRVGNPRGTGLAATSPRACRNANNPDRRQPALGDEGAEAAGEVVRAQPGTPRVDEYVPVAVAPGSGQVVPVGSPQAAQQPNSDLVQGDSAPAAG